MCDSDSYSSLQLKRDLSVLELHIYYVKNKFSYKLNLIYMYITNIMSIIIYYLYYPGLELNLSSAWATAQVWTKTLFTKARAEAKHFGFLPVVYFS